MARNTQLKEQEYQAIQDRYRELCEEMKGQKQKHVRILMILQLEFYKTFRALEYIIFEEYLRDTTPKVDPNQLTIYDLGA